MKYYLFISLYLLVAYEEKKNTPIGYSGVHYSFFVAGHVYGTPGRTKPGIYPLFKDKFNVIKNDSVIKFGIFTGDIVMQCTEEEWNEVDKDISGLSMNIYFTFGNHDNHSRGLFLEKYGNTYYCHTYKHDLFIMLDPNIDGWNISGDQLDFLKQELSEIDSATKNVFVFFHQLLWRSSDNKYKNVKPNSPDGRYDSINFWIADYMYDKYDNITLIAGGMGEGIGDNFLIVDVMNDNTVEYRLVSLNCEDIHCLGKLEKFIIH